MLFETSISDVSRRASNRIAKKFRDVNRHFDGEAFKSGANSCACEGNGLHVDLLPADKLYEFEVLRAVHKLP